jgi:hypothetical protein
MSARRTSLVLAALATGAIAAATPSATPADTWPGAARATARTLTETWASNVRASALVATEPPGRCRKVSRRVADCPIAIVVYVNAESGRRLWRCSATAVVTRRGDRLTGRRVHTHCVA